MRSRAHTSSGLAGRTIRQLAFPNYVQRFIMWSPDGNTNTLQREITPHNNTSETALRVLSLREQGVFGGGLYSESEW